MEKEDLRSNLRDKVMPITGTMLVPTLTEIVTFIVSGSMKSATIAPSSLFRLDANDSL